MATRSRILAWRIPMERGAWRAIVHRVAKSGTRLKRLGISLLTFLQNQEVFSKKTRKKEDR